MGDSSRDVFWIFTDLEIADSAVIYQVVVLAEVGFFSEDDERHSTGQLTENGDNLEGKMLFPLVASDDNRLISHDQSIHQVRQRGTNVDRHSPFAQRLNDRCVRCSARGASRGPLTLLPAS